MGRKGYKRVAGTPKAEQAGSPPGSRYGALLSRRGPTQASFTDESQYRHVRGDLIQIGILALCLFGGLILLRFLSAALGFLP